MTRQESADRLAGEAQTHHAAGRIAAARRACDDALSRAPDHARSRYLLGLIALQSGEFANGITQLERSLQSSPDQPHAYANLGAAYNQLDQSNDALRCCQRALELMPGLFAALFHRGVALRRLGRSRDAVASFEEALKVAPRDLLTLNWLGKSLCDLALYTPALGVLQRAVAISPDDAASWLNIGIARLQAGYHAAALEALDHSLQTAPRQPAAHYNRGLALLALGQAEPAYAAFTAALQLGSPGADALCARARALALIERSEDAAQDLEAAFKAQPQRVDVIINWAQARLDREQPSLTAATLAVLEQTSRADAALDFGGRTPLQLGHTTQSGSALRRLGTDPTTQRSRMLSELRFLCGLGLQQLDRVEQACQAYRSVLDLDPNHGPALSNLAGLLVAQNRHHEALQLLQLLSRIAPDLPYGRGQHWTAARGCCAWDYGDTERAQHLIHRVSERQAVCLPLSLLTVTDEAAAQWHCASAHAQHEYGRIQPSPAVRYQHQRIRVGYLSGDFRDHAVAFLLSGVLEQHDRTRFEVYALSLRARAAGTYGRRIEQAVDHFEELCGLSDEEAARRIRSLEIDLLIDLTGYTLGARPGIVARRPAPIQAGYLGYPGTLGAPYVDYLIADEYVIPPSVQEFYSERVVYLPDCFQANDDQRLIDDAPTRAECGLPASGPVLCCFNASHKLTPEFFSCWMRLLESVPDAVLWLLANNEPTRHNLRCEAARRGIAPERLIFAGTVPYPAHLARLGCADLFLDTLPFNGGTTISDALWAGLPVLTCSGQAFAARMGGSLVRTIGTPELITSTLAEYEQAALALLRDPEALPAMRRRIESARTRSTLFDTRRFTRHFEAALQHMVQRYRDGLPAEHFRINAAGDA